MDFCLCNCATEAGPLDLAGQQRISSHEATDICASYTYDDSHAYLSKVSVFKFDPFTSTACLMNLTSWKAYFQMTWDVEQLWEDSVLKLLADGEWFFVEYNFALPTRLRLGRIPLLQRVFSAARLNWHSADTIRTDSPTATAASWSLPDGSMDSVHPQTVIMQAKLQSLYVTGAERDEAVSYLPDESCRWLRDLCRTKWGGLSESLGVGVARAAITLADSGAPADDMQEFAMRHIRADLVRLELAGKRTPARSLLGQLLKLRSLGQDGD